MPFTTKNDFHRYVENGIFSERISNANSQCSQSTCYGQPTVCLFSQQRTVPAGSNLTCSNLTRNRQYSCTQLAYLQ